MLPNFYFLAFIGQLFAITIYRKYGEVSVYAIQAVSYERVGSLSTAIGVQVFRVLIKS
jgi:hypothetical protein